MLRQLPRYSHGTRALATTTTTHIFGLVLIPKIAALPLDCSYTVVVTFCAY